MLGFDPCGAQSNIRADDGSTARFYGVHDKFSRKAAEFPSTLASHDCDFMQKSAGNVTEMYELNDVPRNFFEVMMRAVKCKSTMSCSIEPHSNGIGAVTEEGLIRGRTYTILKAHYVKIKTPKKHGQIQLLSLRNPRGEEATEWDGKWSKR